MKKLLKGAILVCAVVMFTGCGVMNHMTANTNLTQTSVELSAANYRIVGTVSGTATDNYIFGIGGLSKKALANNSYAEMVANANLKDNQAIINVSTVERIKAYVVYAKREMVTSGVVIEFYK